MELVGWIDIIGTLLGATTVVQVCLHESAQPRFRFPIHGQNWQWIESGELRSVVFVSRGWN